MLSSYREDRAYVVVKKTFGEKCLHNIIAYSSKSRGGSLEVGTEVESMEKFCLLAYILAYMACLACFLFFFSSDDTAPREPGTPILIFHHKNTLQTCLQAYLMREIPQLRALYPNNSNIHHAIKILANTVKMERESA